MNINLNVYFLIFIILLTSCKPEAIIEGNVDLTKGVFIVNEGNFMSNNGEISFYDIESGKLINQLYSQQNNQFVLGDIVQSICISDTLALISVNNSKKIEIVNVNNFKHVQTIIGLSFPRQIISVRENICYLTNGKNPGELKIIDTKNYEIIKTIPVGNQPENLLLFNDKVFITNGSWGHDSTISIIHATTDEFIQTITIGDGTTDIVSDKNGHVWVLCQGKSIFDYPEETASQLVCINPETNEIIERVLIGVTGDEFNPVRLASDKANGFIYYVEKQGVYRLNINNTKEKELFIIGSYYGLEINPENGDVFVFSDNGFIGDGTMTIYNSEGIKIQEAIEVGIGPNGAIFK